MAALVVAMIALCALCALALVYRAGFLASWRSVSLVAVPTGAGIIILLSAIAAAGAAGKPGRRLAWLVSVMACLVLGLFIFTELSFRTTKEAVLLAPRAELAAIGRHVVVGYRDRNELRRLIAAGAVGGVFVTARNALGKTAAELKAEIDGFQALARASGVGRLIIATDQEGGMVSRLSPPLEKPSALAVAAGAAVARAVGEASGRDLAGVGVTLNFAPVVDLDFGIRNPADRYSRIGERAISADPAIVTDVAAAYCDGLALAGVRCTLKHFPGLGRVAEDTHVASARLSVSVEDLESRDWQPFRKVLAIGKAAVMVGHVGVDAIDEGRPASMSPELINGVLRRQWNFDGIIVTDDLTMAATSGRPGGIGAAAVASLAAGSDLLLVSYDTDQVYEVLAHLLRASAGGHIAKPLLAASRRRLEK